MFTFKVRFRKKDKEVAIVQMRSKDHVDSCIRNLNGSFLFDKTITIERSPDIDMECLEETYELWNDTKSYEDFTNCTHHRFSRPNAGKNREVRPSKVMIITTKVLFVFYCFGNVYSSYSTCTVCQRQALHFFNVPPQITAQHLRKLLNACEAATPQKITKWEKGTICLRLLDMSWTVMSNPGVDSSTLNNSLFRR
jgi:RNA recognition motif. (a.k.a. RRM, RBD, or RNP domain)